MLRLFVHCLSCWTATYTEGSRDLKRSDCTLLARVLGKATVNKCQETVNEVRVGYAEKNILLVWIRILADGSEENRQQPCLSEPVLRLHVILMEVFPVTLKEAVYPGVITSHMPRLPVCVALTKSWLTSRVVGCVRGDHSCVSNFFTSFLIPFSVVVPHLFASSYLQCCYREKSWSVFLHFNCYEVLHGTLATLNCNSTPRSETCGSGAAWCRLIHQQKLRCHFFLQSHLAPTLLRVRVVAKDAF
jgi:hypothetical protein